MVEVLAFTRIRGIVVVVAVVALTCTVAFAVGAPRFAGVAGAAGSVLSIASAWLVWRACTRSRARAEADDARARAAFDLRAGDDLAWDPEGLILRGRTHRCGLARRA